MRRTFCILNFAICILLAIAAVGCDSVARATAAPDLTVIVNVPPSGGPTAAPAVPAPPVDAPDSNGATDVDDAPGIADSGDLPPADSPGTNCPDPDKFTGRGEGNGTPGNGKGQGDENGKACR